MPLAQYYLPDDDINVQEKFVKTAPTIGSTYTPKLGSTNIQPTEPEPPKYAIAEFGDKPEDLAEKLGVDVWDVQSTYPDIQAGAAYAMPLSQDIPAVQQELADTKYPMSKYGPEPEVQDEVEVPTLPEDPSEWGYDELFGPSSPFTPKEQEAIRAIGLENFLLESILNEQAAQIGFQETADPYAISGSDAMMYFPEGWNDIWLDWFLTQTEENNQYWDAIYNVNTAIEDYYREEDLAAHREMLSSRYLTGESDVDSLLRQSVTLENYAGQNVERMETITGVDYLDIDDPGFGPGGIPMTAFYGVDEDTGLWVRKGTEEVFDELYEYNDVNPDDANAVERFWDFARDELTHAGVFFEAIRWPSGGGGYGGYTTPSYGGRRPSQTRARQSAYLKLTSWSI